MNWLIGIGLVVGGDVIGVSVVIWVFNRGVKLPR